MLDTRIVLSGLWVAVMLTYLWGDVLRVFSGDAKPGEILGKSASQELWLVIAALFSIPILMVVLTLTLEYSAARWANIIIAIFILVLNLFGLPYKGAYDNFLIVMSFVFNVMTVWYAWKWLV